MQVYEPLVVGKFCEKRDPYLAYIAYAKGFCDEELISITNIIELLKIIREPSPFSDNMKLQNLMMLTAIRADEGKVVNCINKLENYDVEEIAKIVIDHGLYEEAFIIYKSTSSIF